MLRGDRLELTLISCGIEQAGNGIEFAQVDGENLHAILQKVRGFWMWLFFTLSPSRLT